MESATLKQGLEAFFAKTGYSSDSYNDPWVALNVGPIQVWMPNTAARAALVPVHDAHHVLTGYATDVAGEGEAAAWEVASGCGSSGTAWFLNLLAMAPSVFRTPGRTLRAFVRGRRSRNLYGQHALPYAEPLDTLRERLGIQDAERAEPTPADLTAFAAACGVSLVLAAGMFFWVPPIAVAGEVAQRRNKRLS